MTTHDQETRQRLLESSAWLFADRGFNNVTVRQICKAARANVAAVNYHFRDKLGLYEEVVRMAIDAMRSTSEAAMRAGEGAPPEERLRAHIQVFLHRLLGRGRGSWIHKLMVRETADPTPAIDLVVEQAMAPRFEYLSGLVGELLQCPITDERVTRCAASIQSLCLAYLPNPFFSSLRAHLPFMSDLPSTPAEIDRLAEQIADFALAGIRAVARQQSDTEQRDPRRQASSPV